RSRYLHPGAIIREAHLNLFELPNAAMRLLNGERQTAYVKAGPGCFVAAMSVARDVSNDNQYGVYVRVATWLDEDQLHADQIPLHAKGKPGNRLGGDTEVPVAPLRVARRICTTVQRLNPIAHVLIAISPKEQKKRGDRRHDLPVSRKQGVAFRFR
ncbi:MAG TPA: hypothetical protein VKG24_18705, partial [Pseudolabrys sp.]|nr:hypothetical protein [Pseudolabrys sp.]